MPVPDGPVYWTVIVSLRFERRMRAVKAQEPTSVFLEVKRTLAAVRRAPLDNDGPQPGIEGFPGSVRKKCEPPCSYRVIFRIRDDADVPTIELLDLYKVRGM